MAMKEQLRRLGSDSIVYGVSTILGRFLNFLLVPFYTNVFVAADYGIVTVVYTVVAFLNVLYALGLEAAYMRYTEGHPEFEQKDIFSGPLILITVVAAALSTGIALSGDMIAHSLQIRAEWMAIVPLTALTLFIDAFNVIPFAALRMKHRPKRFAFIRFSSIVINVGLNLWFVLGLRMSIVAVFLAGLIASLSSTILLVPEIREAFVARIRMHVLRPMLRLGLPTLPAGLALMVVQVLDRLLMQQMVDTRTAGIYGANYRLGIFMMLFVTMFQFAWQPFYLQQASKEGAERLFARILTYFLLIAAFLFLALSFYIDDLATIPLFHGRTLLGREYWEGLPIVPVVLLGYVFTGVATIVNAGLLIRKRTAWMAGVTAAGALVNIVSNLLLIPRYGMMGGAISTLAAYLVMALLYWVVTRRVYRVPYETARLVRIAVACAVPATVWGLGLHPFALSQPLWEGLLLVSFPLLLFASGFFLPSELGEARRLVRLMKR